MTENSLQDSSRSLLARSEKSVAQVTLKASLVTSRQLYKCRSSRAVAFLRWPAAALSTPPPYQGTNQVLSTPREMMGRDEGIKAMRSQ